MLILAGVTITFVLGEGGILDMAKEAAEKTKNSIANDQSDMKNLANQIENLLGGSTTGGSDSSDGEDQDAPTTLKEAIEQGYEFTKNTPLKDEFENPVTIPAGFHIVTKDDDPTVDYSYSVENEGTPTVQDGIVVADGEGNQFVWIPVGTIKNKSDDRNGKTTTITLGRYTFNSDDGTPSEPNTDGSTIDTEYTEDTKDINNSTGKSNYGNAIAKDIDAFKRSASAKEAGGNGGYYLARFEAGIVNYDPDKITTSLSGNDINNWTGYQAQEGKTLKIVIKKGQQVWNYIRQGKASAVARAMYPEDKPYTSDLVNSYAWDTAIVFIQKYSENRNYANETTGDSQLKNLTGSTTDKVCNIYDMASNCVEWSTETRMNSRFPFVIRGGSYDDAVHTYVSSRYVDLATYALEIDSFRPILYVNH